MQRQEPLSESKEIAGSEIKETNKLRSLPEATLRYTIIPYLSGFDLINTKKVSRWFKAFSENYIGQTVGQVFYAADGCCQLGIGTQTRIPSFSRSFKETITTSELIRAFRRTDYPRSDSYTKLFKTEKDALSYLFRPDHELWEQNLHGARTISRATFPVKVICVTPIYRVQIVHPSVTFRTCISGSKTVKAQDSKELALDKTDTPWVKVAALLPLSASVRWKFFYDDPYKTLVENADLTKSEPEVKPTRSSRCQCPIM